MITSNHIYLLVKDTGSNVIVESMQLIAGRTAQEYNERTQDGTRSDFAESDPGKLFISQKVYEVAMSL